MQRRSDKSNTMSDKEYEKLGKLLFSIGEIGSKNKRELYKVQFIKGVMSGFGGVIGATLIIAILLIILSVLNEIPFIGDVAKNITNTIENR